MTFKRSSNQVQVYVGELEAAGTRLKSARRLTQDEAANSFSTWTADSKCILFSSNRSGSDMIYGQAIDQRAAQALVSSSHGSRVGISSPSPDGTSLLYVAHQEPGSTSALFRIMRVPIHGGLSQLVLEGRNTANPVFHCTIAPATFCAVGEFSAHLKLLTITSFDPLEGRGRVLKTIVTEPSVRYDWTLTPHDSKFAFMRRGESEALIRLFSLSGGSDQEITVKGWGCLLNLESSPDGKAFYCGSTSPEAARQLRIYIDCGEHVLGGRRVHGDIWAIASPDGRIGFRDR